MASSGGTGGEEKAKDRLILGLLAHVLEDDEEGWSHGMRTSLRCWSDEITLRRSRLRRHSPSLQQVP